MNALWIPQAIASAMLLWALVPSNPYSYYVLLRIVCCACFGWLAIQAKARDLNGWMWAFVGLAVVYNPVLRVHMTRDFWSVVNVATIVVALLSIKPLAARS